MVRLNRILSRSVAVMIERKPTMIVFLMMSALIVPPSSSLVVAVPTSIASSG